MQGSTRILRSRWGVASAAVAVVVLVAGTASSTHGQSALGDGRALDNNLRTGTGGLNSTIGPGGGRVLDNNLRVGSGGWNDVGRNFASEVAFRNAIVTGNVGGGREFRGSVGYTAADDFRGFLGSNATFQFEKDSFYSGLATRNLSGIDSIRNPLAYTVAGQRDSVFGGGVIVNRSGVGATAGEVQGVGPVGSDVFGNISGTLRSPSFQSAQSQRMPDVIALGGEPDSWGTFDVMTASPLIGIKSMRSNSTIFSPREREAPAGARGLPGTALPGTGIPGVENSATPGLRPIPSPHQVVLEVLRGTPVSAPVGAETLTGAPFASSREPGVAGEIGGSASTKDRDGIPPVPGLTEPSFDQNLESLREMLRDAYRGEAGTVPETRGGGAESGSGSDGSAPEDEDESPVTAPELAAQILAGKSAHVMELSAYPTQGEIFGLHMRRGQELMAARRWFDAEERFTAALAARPGDPMAAGARVNAQIGAGMYRSAAVNFRNLIEAYPEMAVVRFDGSLIGGSEETARVKALMRARTEVSAPTGRDCALLLAYMGFQTEDRGTIESAFSRLEFIAKEMEIPMNEFERSMRAIWMASSTVDSPEPGTVPAETP